MRLLPPLAVALALALVGVRCALGPAREEARDRIAGLVQGRDLEAASRQLGAYAARYDAPEDRWFACAMWFRLQQPQKAIDAVWSAPALAADRATARRFAETALYAVGWNDDSREDPTALEPFALLALSEGGNAWADAQLTHYALTLDLLPFTAYFFPAVRRATSRPMGVLVAAMRRRKDEGLHIAAPLGALGTLPAGDYPEREADLEVLREVVPSPQWRREYRDVWAASAVALGRSLDPQGLEILERTVAELDASGAKRDEDDLPLVINGLLAGGRFEKEQLVAQRVFSAQPPGKVVIWYAEALIHCYRRGDRRPELRLRQLWEGPSTHFPGLRARVARALLLHDEPPGDEALATFVDRMVRDLEQDPNHATARVLAAAWRLRAGDPGAREALLGLLRELGGAYLERQDDALDVSTPFLEALRALYLYG